VRKGLVARLDRVDGIVLRDGGQREGAIVIVRNSILVVGERRSVPDLAPVTDHVARRSLYSGLGLFSGLWRRAGGRPGPGLPSATAPPDLHEQQRSDYRIEPVL